MPTAPLVPPRKTMRQLAATILGPHAEKQIRAALGCSEAQAHRIVHHDRTPSALRQALIDFLERRLVFAKRRLEAAENELREIRVARMVGRAETRLLAPDRRSAGAASRMGARQQAAALTPLRKEPDRG